VNAEDEEEILKSLELLIKHGVDVNAVDNDGTSALAHAIRFNFKECIKVLYAANVESSRLVMNGKTYSALELIQRHIEDLQTENNNMQRDIDRTGDPMMYGARIWWNDKDIRKKTKLYQQVKKLERERWTGKTVRAVQQWRPDGGDVDRPRSQYNQMRDVFRKFAQSGYQGGSRSRSRSPRRGSRSRSRRERRSRSRSKR